VKVQFAAVPFGRKQQFPYLLQFSDSVFQTLDLVIDKPDGLDRTQFFDTSIGGILMEG
jgi:hypothetical protein